MKTTKNLAYVEFLAMDIANQGIDVRPVLDVRTGYAAMLLPDVHIRRANQIAHQVLTCDCDPTKALVNHFFNNPRLQ